jgi:zinc protease
MHLFCDGGSAYEIDGLRGASHLVEHMCFKGTESIRRARNVLVQYNKIGADFNAYTVKRFTTYHINCEDVDVSHCLELLADMVLHSIFSKKEFDKEQHVVVEENIRAEDNNMNVLEEKLDAIMYQGSSYENPVDNIRYHPTPTHLKYEDIRNWYKWFYRPSNMICSIVTNLSYSQVIAILKRTHFMESVRACSTPIGLPTPILTLLPINDCPQQARIEYIKKKGVSTDILTIGFRTCAYNSPDKYTLMLLQQILNGFSGKLFTALRTKRGLTYSSSCSSEYQEHTGSFTISVVTNPRKLLKDQDSHDGVLPVLIHMLRHLKQHGVTSEELSIAKGSIQGTLVLELRSNDAIATYNGIQTLLDVSTSIVPYYQIYEKYMKNITRAQIHRVIKQYLRRENMLVGILYDHKIPQHTIEAIVDQFV